MKTEVISLGGSLLFKGEKVDYKFIDNFKKLINSFKDRKFVIVLGGGFVARTYINALEYFRVDEMTRCNFGIGITRTNARLLANAFGKITNTQHLPKSLKDVKNFLSKHKVVCCGGLRYHPDQTSDGTTAQIANHLKTRFINITNVKGLYTKDPKKNKNAKLISRINYKDFSKIVKKIKYKPGQHFILDQNAAEIIKKHRIPTYIINHSLKNLKNLLRNKKFVGTVIN